MPRWHSSSCYYHPPASSSSTPKVHRPALARPYTKRSSPTPAPPFIMPKRPPPFLCASGGRGYERPGWIAFGDIDSGRRTTEYVRHGGRRERGSHRHRRVRLGEKVRPVQLGSVTEMIGSKQTLTGARPS